MRASASAIDHDLHVHTYLSDCCHDKANHTPARILEAAAGMGLRTVGFTDHLWANSDLEPSDWYRPQDEGQIFRLQEDLGSISTNVRVLIGCEAETIAPGKFGITPEFAEELDFVLLACSHFHMTGFVQQPESHEPHDVARHTMKFFVSAVESGVATAIPHPFMPMGFQDRFDEVVAEIPDAEFTDAFGIAAEKGVGIEITTSFLPPEPRNGRPPTWHIETPIRLLELARRAGCKFFFATDAHDLAMLKGLRKLGLFAEALGLTEEGVLPLARGA